MGATARHIHLGRSPFCRPAGDGASKRCVTGRPNYTYRIDPDVWASEDQQTLHHTFCNDLWQDAGEEIRVRRIPHAFPNVRSQWFRADEPDDGLNSGIGHVALWAELHDYQKRRLAGAVAGGDGMWDLYYSHDTRVYKRPRWRGGTCPRDREKSSWTAVEYRFIPLTPLVMTCRRLYEELMPMVWRSVSFGDLASMALFLDNPMHSAGFLRHMQKMSVDVELQTDKRRLAKSVRLWSTVCDVVAARCRLLAFKMRLDVDVDADPRARATEQLCEGEPAKREIVSFEERISVSNKWIGGFLEEARKVAEVVPEVEVEVTYNEVRREMGPASRLCRIFRSSGHGDKALLEGGVEVCGWSVIPCQMPQSGHWRLNVWRASRPGTAEIGRARTLEFVNWRRLQGRWYYWNASD